MNHADCHHVNDKVDDNVDDNRPGRCSSGPRVWLSDVPQVPDSGASILHAATGGLFYIAPFLPSANWAGGHGNPQIAREQLRSTITVCGNDVQDVIKNRGV